MSACAPSCPRTRDWPAAFPDKASDMLERVAQGLAAGAAGTTALDTVSYLDMALRGRPSSSVPGQAAQRLAERAGVDLGEGKARESREQGVGALLGYVTGLAAGCVYGLVRPALGDLSRPVAGTLLGLGVMAATDGAQAALGTTNPKDWSATDWVSDLVPHLAYGWAAAWTYDALDD